MARCRATKTNGERCKGIAATGSDWCPSHDPTRQEQRRRAASKAAKSKGGGEIKALKDQAARLYQAVRSGDVDPKVGGVLVQLINAHARLLEIQRRLDDQREFEGRIAQLEQRWGT